MSSARWRIAVASAIGTSHEGSGAPCQDSAALIAIDASDGPILVAAVSDGAGSAAHSHIGSALAVRTLVELARQYFEAGGALAAIGQDDALRWVRETAEAVDLAAMENGHLPRDYSCTLLAAVVGTTEAAFIQVGDGAIVVSAGDEDGWSYVFWPQHGEYANTTNFIQSTDIGHVLSFELAPRPITEFAVFSDGIENLVLHKAERSVHQGFFHEMIQPVRRSIATGVDETLSDGLRRYLSSPIICERTDDDKTLLLATRILDEESPQ